MNVPAGLWYVGNGEKEFREQQLSGFFFYCDSGLILWIYLSGMDYFIRSHFLIRYAANFPIAAAVGKPPGPICH